MDRSEELDSITKELEHLGIKDFFKKAVADQVKSGKDKIEVKGTIPFDELGKTQQLEYSVFLKKYGQSNLFHPYMFQASLKNKPGRSRCFKIADHIYIGMKDAFNLLNGRAINKLMFNPVTKKIDSQWIQGDFAKKDQHGNFVLEKMNAESTPGNLTKSLSDYPIEELMNSTARLKLIQSIYDGNAAPVTLLQSGKDVPGFVTACPRTHSIEVYTVKSDNVIKVQINPDDVKGKTALGEQKLKVSERKKSKSKSL